MVQFVSIGEVKAGCQGDTLITTPLGSCVACAAIDPLCRIGAVAHIMLPGRARKGERAPLRYASNALDALVALFVARGTGTVPELPFCLAGGGNVLRRTDDTICEENLASIKSEMRKRNLFWIATSTGGYERRTLQVDIDSGRVGCTCGDTPAFTLFAYAANRRSSLITNYRETATYA